MGGVKKWFPERHGKEVVRRFVLHRNGDEENGWDPQRANDPPQRKGSAGALDSVALWHKHIKDADPEAWKDVTLQIFRNHVPGMGTKFIKEHGEDGPVTILDEGASPAPARAKKKPAQGNDAIEQTTEDVLKFGKIVLNVHQVLFQVSKQGGGASRRITCVIQSVSGWTISQENNHGDFCALSPDGSTLCLNITSNDRLFHRDAAERLLVTYGGHFGGVYEPRHGNDHQAVTAMRTAISALMPDGQVPRRLFEIPLLKRCKGLRPVEFLHGRPRDGIRVASNASVPASLFYTQRPDTHLNVGTIHVELDVIEEKREASLPNAFAPRMVTNSPTIPGAPGRGTRESAPLGRGVGGGGAFGRNMGGGMHRTSQASSGARARPAASLSPIRSQGLDPPPGDEDAGANGSMRRTLSMGDDVKKALDDVLQPLSDRVEKLELDMDTVKADLKKLEDTVDEYKTDAEMAETEMQTSLTSATNKLYRLNKQMSVTLITNKNIHDVVEGYHGMINKLKGDSERQKEFHRNLVRVANETKVHVEKKLKSLENRIDDNEFQGQESIIESRLQGIADEMKKMFDEYINEPANMEQINFVLNNDYKNEEDAEAQKVYKKFQPNYEAVRQEVKEDLERSQKLYKFCCDMLASGEISMPTEVPPVTPPRNSKMPTTWSPSSSSEWN